MSTCNNATHLHHRSAQFGQPLSIAIGHMCTCLQGGIGTGRTGSERNDMPTCSARDPAPVHLALSLVATCQECCAARARRQLFWCRSCARTCCNSCWSWFVAACKLILGFCGAISLAEAAVHVFQLPSWDSCSLPCAFHPDSVKSCCDVGSAQGFCCSCQGGGLFHAIAGMLQFQ